MESIQMILGLNLNAPSHAQTANILTPPAQQFLLALARQFEPTRQLLLQARKQRQTALDQGHTLDFLSQTANVRESDWRVAQLPNDLRQRRVEITGPVERKMIINALNSGADVFMADFEDSNAPTWNNLIDGQVNLRDAVRRNISLQSAEKNYSLNEKTATLMVRPRGWHLPENHVLVDGAPISASLFDFALFLFHNAEELRARGTGAYFYLPKLESHLEARLWNQVFDFSEDHLGLPRGTICCTVLIETIFAAFEMDEILFELREHIVGLNCGRWDYIFSTIRAFQKSPNWTLPDRSLIGMTAHFLRSYSQLLIKTCHRRGALAMGGMAAQIPIKNDQEANEAALAKVRADKLREVRDGHDGTWVAHPALVPVAMNIFVAELSGDNQLEKRRDDVHVIAHDLLALPPGNITEAGVRNNVTVALQYLAAWLAGNGCVPIHNLMEDAATAEISRSQLWHWIHHGVAKLDDGRVVDRTLVGQMLVSELATQKSARPASAMALQQAHDILYELIFDDSFTDFLTLPAYSQLLSQEGLST
jgi:malate synthase